MKYENSSRNLPSKEKARAMIAVGLISILALYAMVSASNHYSLQNYASKIISREFFISRSITRFEQKLDCIKDSLDPSKSVGFISMEPPGLAIEHLQLVQYTLAPILIDRTNTTPLVIGYFPEKGGLNDALEKHPNLEIIKDCNNGMYLFVRE